MAEKQIGNQGWQRAHDGSLAEVVAWRFFRASSCSRRHPGFHAGVQRNGAPSIVFQLLPLLIPALLFAQDHPIDLTGLSLEKFLAVAVTPSNADVTESFVVGSLRAAYQFAHIDMERYRDGRREVSLQEVLGKYPVAPIEMQVDFHHLNIRYVPLRNIAFSINLPFIKQTTEHLRRDGSLFTLSSSGLGDIVLLSFINLLTQGGRQYVLDFGASLPTGSVNETGTTPRGPATQLPYTMQLGSGTVDLVACLKLLHQSGLWRYGLRAQGKVRTGMNDSHYGLGNRLLLSLWVSPKWWSWFAPVATLNASSWGRINGADPLLDPTTAPVADPALHGGERLDLRLRLSFGLARGEVNSQQVSVEFGLPVYQSLNGPQLETGQRWGVSWQWTIHP